MGGRYRLMGGEYRLMGGRCRLMGGEYRTLGSSGDDCSFHGTDNAGCGSRFPIFPVSDGWSRGY